MKILLIAGGWSSEREISLIGARSIEKALLSRGHSVTFCDLKTDFDRLLDLASQHDFAYLNLHGTPGEDGLVQAMLDAVSCPYQGANPSGSFLALNKAVSKQVMRKANIPTADWEFLPERPEPSWSPHLPYPIFVKSNMGGSSLHLGRAATKQELDALLSDIFAHGDTALLEPALKGRDVTCGFIGGEALPPVLILPVAGDYFDFESKYADGGAKEICPAPLPEKIIQQVQAYTVQACTALGIDYGRADFILGEDESLHILEVNTLPGMTPASLVPKEAAALGWTFADLLEKLIALGLQRSQNK